MPDIVFTDYRTGVTDFYAYPLSESLADWDTHKLQLTERSAPDEKMYDVTVPNTKGLRWRIFKTATQPADWDDYKVADFRLDSPSSTVLPAVANLVSRGGSTLLQAYVGETIEIELTLYQADGTTPVDMSAKSLRFICESDTGTDKGVVENTGITVSGTDNNVVKFNLPSGATSAVGRFLWSLRDDAAPSKVYAQGTMIVSKAAKKD